MTKIVAINGSYRDGGITDQVIDTMAQVLESLGAEVEIIHLRQYQIEFCQNCRQCTQQPGDKPGQCVQQDSMQQLIDLIEQADGYILASPTNFGSVTAVFKRFLERLLPYTYWPWDMNSPTLRKKDLPKKKAALISSCAAPGLMGRLFYTTSKQLKMAANTIGADSVGMFVIGLISKESTPELSERARQKATALAQKLV